ncbi:MAG: DNA polymerase III subunit gamma/tau [Candidatus Thiodiazotropha lotti]|uniref:DNA polymerase III subunit gamma/tau n=2 Tax=Candidatus Thiodiazotropha TaxID=1913444 RepID=A0A1E2UR34_9GAMM|nr:DNA polymerase III subunit gamma/tau [Candidatus Thiodiazotropha endoloripes]MCG7896850.1 DNA polymerase III subunit gamma/tau [Candidatus Thiodiazotropha weberae]MCG7990019.1 DNA polymerase III subunit gamma/tau [Candidatus Thiodiazotropha lotti]MCG7904074.1 DNA polymerase III subunit gamma/tau [Candidatus Thiodiazotropha weberae]MCG7914328.1 DNA polymerase III subunit gamma/tau [Candidatus Thiodiazotropha weberae]MCG8000650.1 DNA polymerase III subunit gamma/tau [Candidatus Thiodiazotroph
MSYQVLARKWRPQLFGQLVGQQHVVTALNNALERERLHHAYLFTGTRGVGKTTLARIFAKSLNCEKGISAVPCGVCDACREIDEGRFVDLLEVDAASRTKVDQTRELLENVPYAPVRGRYKVYLIDEVHMFSASSFNALLKTLEEPPPHVKFILATTDPQKVPVTVLSRCLQFNLKRLSREQIEGQLRHILGEEKIPFDEESLSLLARGADGSMRDGLSLLDQAIAFGGGEVRGEAVKSMIGVIGSDRIYGLVEALTAGEGASLLDRVSEMAEMAVDFSQALQELLVMLHQIALLQLVSGYQPDDGYDIERLKGFSEALAAEDVQLYYQVGLMGQQELNLAPDPRSGFEMVLLRMLAFRPEEGSSGVTQPSGSGNRVSRQSAPRTNPQVSNKSAPAAVAKPAQPAAPAEPAKPVANANDPSDWESFCTALQLGGITRQLAQNCAFGSWDGKTLNLTLDTSRRQLRVGQSEMRLLEGIRKQLGESVQLSITEAVPQQETPAMREKRELDQRQAEAETSMAVDPMVKEMEERFGAKLMPESIRPVDDSSA